MDIGSIPITESMKTTFDSRKKEKPPTLSSLDCVEGKVYQCVSGRMKSEFFSRINDTPSAKINYADKLFVSFFNFTTLKIFLFTTPDRAREDEQSRFIEVDAELLVKHKNGLIDC